MASSLLLGYVSSRLNAFVLVSSLPRDLNGLALTPHQFGYIQVGGQKGRRAGGQEGRRAGGQEGRFV